MNASPTNAPLQVTTGWLRRLRIRVHTFVITRPADAPNLAQLRKDLDTCIAYLDPIVADQLRPHVLPPDTLLLRPALRANAIEMILLGQHAVEQAPLLMRAWHLLEANGMGQHPGHQMLQLGPWISVNPRQEGFCPSDGGMGVRKDPCWPWKRDPQTEPIRMQFDVPLSLPTGSCGFNEAPTWSDLAVLTAERLAMLAGTQIDTVTSQWVAATAASAMASAWHESAPSARLIGSYSPVMLRRGVCGWIDFPNGIGLLWPLVAALPFMHVGRFTRIGFGKPTLIAQ